MKIPEKRDTNGWHVGFQILKAEVAYREELRKKKRHTKQRFIVEAALVLRKGKMKICYRNNLDLMLVILQFVRQDHSIHEKLTD